MTETYNLDEYDAPIGAILSLMSGRLTSTPSQNAMEELVRLSEFLIRDALCDTSLRHGHLTETLRNLCRGDVSAEVLDYTYEMAVKKSTPGTGPKVVMAEMREKWEEVYGPTIRLRAPVSC